MPYRSAVPVSLRTNGASLRPVPFNPLTKEALARSVEYELLAQTSQPLEQVPRFLGPGIYVIYYVGPHPLYQAISGTDKPIYVGKAVPAGARKALTDDTKVGTPLWNRIDEHRESVTYAADLEPLDFRVRYLVADELFIPLAETLMIRTLHPVWNQVVDGFGNHDPGRGRYDSKLPDWDTLHPGRPWAARIRTPGRLRSELEARVRAHFELWQSGVTVPET
jgi:hypothetical protein